MVPVDSPSGTPPVGPPAEPGAAAPSFTRRSVLRLAGAAALILPAAAVLAAEPRTSIRALTPLARQPAWAGTDPFTLGVASGAPRPDGFVLWTRLAPDPLSPELAGGIASGDHPIGYEVATDPFFQRVVQHGKALAESAFAHSVHLEVRGLEPARPYWYRFFAGPWASPVGRAVTAPAAGSPISAMRFGYCCCSNYEQGYFAAYRHLADESPDLVLFLGDYIYESIDRSPGVVRHHSDGVPATNLALYRNRYAQYRLDPDLQRLHATATSLFTWDDHEVQNDYAGMWSEDLIPAT